MFPEHTTTGARDSRCWHRLPSGPRPSGTIVHLAFVNGVQYAIRAAPHEESGQAPFIYHADCFYFLPRRRDRHHPYRTAGSDTYSASVSRSGARSSAPPTLRAKGKAVTGSSRDSRKHLDPNTIKFNPISITPRSTPWSRRRSISSRRTIMTVTCSHAKTPSRTTRARRHRRSSAFRCRRPSAIAFRASTGPDHLGIR